MNTIKLNLMIIALVASSSCKRDQSGCYDAKLQADRTKRICTADCPGVVACNGKTYCNECMANNEGYRVDK
jgi:hypothetical protein